MNNMQKAFKAKSKLRRMADGGPVQRVRDFFNPPDDRSDTDRAAGVPKPGSTEENKELARRVTKQPGFFPTYSRSQLRQDMAGEYQKQGDRVFASGMADGGMVGQAANIFTNRKDRTNAAIDAAERGEDPPSMEHPEQPAPATDPARKPKERNALRDFFGLADGGQILKSDVGGVPTFTDARAATAGATPYTPGSAGGGSFSVMGVDPRVAATNAAAQKEIDARKAAANPQPATLGSKIDEYLKSKQAPGASPLPGAAPAATQPSRPNFNSVAADGMASAQAGMSAGLSAIGSNPPPGPAPLDFASAAPQPSLFDEEPAGFAHGGKVNGPGGPTDDKVGPVMLSHGEYVLPADTVKKVGKENLDRLRDNTHEFVKEKPLPNGLRGMANGNPVEFDVERPRPGRVSVPSGGVIEVAPNGVARTTAMPTNQFPVKASPVEPTMKISAADIERARAYTDARFGSTAPPNAPAGPAAPEVAPKATGGLRGLAGKGFGIAGAVLGAKQIYDETQPGGQLTKPENPVRVRFKDGSENAFNPGADTAAPVGSEITANPLPRSQRLGGSLSSGLPSTFNKAPAGLMAKIGPSAAGGGTNDAMGNLRNGQAPGNGFEASNVPGIFQRGAGADPKSGKPLGEFVGVGRPAAQEDPVMAELRSALRGLGGNRGGGNFNAPSNERDINKRYDKLAKDLSGMYSSKGQGNLAKRLLELENARSNALGEDARNGSALRGQSMQAQNYANQAEMQARTAALGQLGAMSERQQAAAASAQKAILDAAGTDRDAQEKGVRALTDFSARQFDTDTPEGKQQASAYERYVLATNPDFLSAGAEDRQRMLAESYPQYMAEATVRKAAKGQGVPVSQGRNEVTEAAEGITIGDVWNNRASPLDWRPWSTEAVQLSDAEGNPTLKIPRGEYLRSNGAVDADLLNALKKRQAQEK